MKNMFTIVAMTILSSSVFAAQPNTYSCEGYTLSILNENGSTNLKNDSANSSSDLAVAGLSSGFSKTVIFNGTLVPVGMDVLARVLVTVDDTLFKGASTGKISVGSAASNSDSIEYNCTKQ